MEASKIEQALVAARSHLAECLAETGAPMAERELVAAMRSAEGFDAVLAVSGVRERPLKGLAKLIERAEAGRAEEALAYTGLAVPNRASPALHTLVRALESEAVERPAGPLLDASGQPVVFVVSFPRSGSTRFLNFLMAGFPGSRFTAFLKEGQYFSTKGAGSAFAGPVFVKDHALRADYATNPVIYLVRDGRDAMLSFNDYTLRKPGLDAAELAAGAQNLSDVLTDGGRATGFGPWPDHVHRAFDWRDQGRSITVVTYDALMGENGYEAIRDTLAAVGIEYTPERYEKGVEVAAKREATLRQNNPNWKRTRIYPEGSMMDRWLDTPEASKWRVLLDAADRQLLHEAGFTEALMRSGFEDDAEWWRS